MTKSYSMNVDDVKPSSEQISDVVVATNGMDKGKYSDGATNNDDKKDDKDNKEKKVQMVGIIDLFRYSSVTDRVLMFVGTICAMALGAAMPVMLVIFGNMTDSFINDSLFDNLFANLTSQYPINVTKAWIYDNPESFLDILDDLGVSESFIDVFEDVIMDGSLFDTMRTYSVYYAAIGCGVLILAIGQVTCWQYAAYSQGERIRQHLLQAILRQDIGWFDVHEVGELNTRISDDVDQIEIGIGEKLSLLFGQLAAFLAGFIAGFVFGWKLTLVILAISPIILGSIGFLAKAGADMTSKELAAYSKAGAVAEEVLGAIRTVVAFGGQQKECDRYYENLHDARRIGIAKSFVTGIGMLVLMIALFGSYGLGFWYGSTLVFSGEYSPGDLLIIFFCILVAAFQLGVAAPNIQDFSTGRGAAYAVFSIIDQIPPIDSMSEEGVKPEMTGNVEFDNVVFRYPSRTEVTVLKGVSFKVNVGETVALVGSSGCGKSTTIQLIQRFYDPEEGRILVGGVDVKDYHLKYLRQNIGVVSQEPVLFGTTIEENIRYGREGVTQEEIIEATKSANAYNFINELPDGLKTLVGERGAQLSGGQKQRIAISRALVRNPKVLLLDEATSALDTESESTVQEALDKARMGRTTIVVAHRLSTIKNADRIVGFKNGNIVEEGTHDELMELGGVYHKLVTNQLKMNANKGDDDDDEEDDDDDLDEEEESGGEGLKRMLSVESRGGGRKRCMSTGSTKGVDRSTSITSRKVEDEDDDENPPDPGLKRIMRLNTPEWHLIVLGTIAAVISGGVQPVFSIVFAEVLGIFSLTDQDEMNRQSVFYACIFVVIGVAAGLAMFAQNALFGLSGENLTMRMRQMTFKALLRQEISYFDDRRNNTGALCTRLATDASAVKGATGTRLASLCQAIASIAAGLAIGFAFSWQLTLLIIAFAPFILIGSAAQVKVISGNKVANKKAMESSGKVAVEAVENIRTVASLTKEIEFHNDYCKMISGPYRRKRLRSVLQGLTYGMSMCVIYFAYACCFLLGAHLIETRRLTYTELFRVFGAIVFSASSAGQVSSYAPDYGKAKISAARIFALFDSEPSIDSASEEGEKPSTVEGNIELTNAQFVYPMRPDVKVLRGVDVSVRPGQTVALVGPSGCGKSTIVQLLERFYDPAGGTVKLDGRDLKGLHIQWLRAQMGIVSQEPILFDCSIKENIAYGDNNREVQMDEIIQAARNANIHNFIETLPQGYGTNVGDKGTQLSGGQKQRVAIARALVRNPRILLLDEATSALDTESEKVVQDALDRAREGRTSIVIAHRLSTIENADNIIVIRNGKVAEMGTHHELLALNGIYHKLNTIQMKRK